MSTLHVAISGAHGYAGGHISTAIERRGLRVIELVRRPRSGGLRLQVPFDLERGIEPVTLRDVGIDTLVHAAWDFRQTRPEDIRRVNRDGAMRLFDAFTTAGGKTGVLISTISAFDGCSSHYGRFKREVERDALERGFWVVRPGLIQGGAPGGIVGTMLKLVRRSPVVPILGYGQRILNPISAEELSRCVAQLVELAPTDSAEALVIVAQHRRLSLDEIVRDLISQFGLGRRLLLPVPWQPVWFILRVMESFGLSLGLRSDSVISLVNQAPDLPIRSRPWFHPDPPERSTDP